VGRAGPQILGLVIALVGLGEPGWAQSPTTAVELRPLVGETRLSPGDSLLRLPELKPEVLRDYLRRIEQERTLPPTGSVRLPSGPTLNAPAVTPVDPVQLLQTLRIDRSAPLLATRPEQVAIARTIALDLNQAYAVAALLHTMLHDADSTVRDEARLALEQLEQPDVLERLQTLVDEGLIS